MAGQLSWDNVTVTPEPVVPEPSTWVLLACVLPVVALLHRRRRMLRL